MPKLKIQDPVAPSSVPVRDVRELLKEGIETIANGYREVDGVIRDVDAVYDIACHQRALELLPKR